MENAFKFYHSLLLRWAELGSTLEGFYVSPQNRNGKQNVILVAEVSELAASSSSNKRKTDKQRAHKKDIMLQIYRPNTGLQVRHESMADIEKKYKKITSDDAMIHWEQQYDASINTCSHAYWRGVCRTVSAGGECEVKKSDNHLRKELLQRKNQFNSCNS